MSKKIHIKEIEKYCNENGYYIGEYWFPNKRLNQTKMSKEDIIQRVIKILESSDYIDISEHVQKGIRFIKKDPNNLQDFLWCLESPTVMDIDGKVGQCADMIRPLLNQNKDE